MINDKISEYKDAVVKYREAKAYIEKNSDVLKKDPEKFDRIMLNFKNKFESRVHKAFDDLPEYLKEFNSREYYVEICNVPWLDEAKETAEFFNVSIQKIFQK